MGAMPLKKVRIDLAQLRMAFEDHNPEAVWYLDTQTGDVFALGDFGDDIDLPAPAEEIEQDESGRFLLIEPDESREGYRDMEEFVATVKDGRFRELLEVAIAGKGAFRRFKDVLAKEPDERQRWFKFHEERLNGRIRASLAEKGIEAV